MEQELHTQRSWPIEKCSSLAAHDETSLPLLIHHQKDLPAAAQHQVAFGPPPWQGGTAFAVSEAKDRNVSPEPNVDTNSVQGFLSVGGIVCSW